LKCFKLLPCGTRLRSARSTWRCQKLHDAVALKNGVQLEDVQKAAWHRDASTTELYDRRSYNPEKASFFATY